ncbi:hypothetical protein HMPREF1321_0269 [Capnocytophaga sp. oral taxon 412 str. F0487]|nr:hypothetical protein HMPREF1321_0269 [Capnocytophaga sp. oral taxon 412 str. F0487]
MKLYCGKINHQQELINKKIIKNENLFFLPYGNSFHNRVC